MLVLITSERPSPRERRQYNQLFALGLGTLHLRMPGATQEQYEEVICSIAPKYRDRIVICDYFHLVNSAGLGGIHLSGRYREQWEELAGAYRSLGRVSISAHSLEELNELQYLHPTYALLSPVYDSISKEGYKARINLSECSQHLPSLPFPVLGLGGITPRRAIELRRYGFSGAAIMGYLRASKEDITTLWCEFDRPRVLSIGGHDPCSGAGIVADARAIDHGGGYPLTICSCLTIQREDHFERTLSLPQKDINDMLSCLFASQRPLVAKIGMVASMEQALELMQRLRSEGVRHIIWDPIRSASASREVLHNKIDPKILTLLLDKATLITPNKVEAEWILGNIDQEQISQLAQKHQCAILIKGGHSDHPYLSTDMLYTPLGDVIHNCVSRSGWDKHGTGCSLSASIALHLAQGYDLPAACRRGQLAVDALRHSSPSLLGNHDYNQTMISNKGKRLKEYRLQWITDSHDIDELLARAKALLQGGIRWIQLRMKEAISSERLRCALSLKELMRDYPDSILIIDDDVEVALMSNADGVHLGLNDMPIAQARKLLGDRKIIGGTCNTPMDLHLRALEGADYIGVGPWRMTTTKRHLAPILGIEGISQMVHANRLLPYPLPLYSIGGITCEDLPTLANLGVHGVALSGILSKSERPQQEVQDLLEVIGNLSFSCQ